MALEIIIPVITSAPHNSADLHGFRKRILLSEWQIEEMSDAFTAGTAFHPRAIANLVSKEHRILGDKNRKRTAQDVFPSEDFRGNKVWEEEPDPKLKERLLKAYYDPYYEEGQQEIEAAHGLGFGRVIYWDNHDTGDYNPATGQRDRKLKGEDRTMPPFVISNYGVVGTGEIDYDKFEDREKAYVTAPPELMRELQGLIVREFDLSIADVDINSESMKGGNMVQHYGNPNYPSDLTIWAVQVEYNRGFVIDQATREPYENVIEVFNKRFNRIMADLAENTIYER